jgi:hypothetical protein
VDNAAAAGSSAAAMIVHGLKSDAHGPYGVMKGVRSTFRVGLFSAALRRSDRHARRGRGENESVVRLRWFTLGARLRGPVARRASQREPARVS